jgi:putative ABC transport system substrate-binding protein
MNRSKQAAMGKKTISVLLVSLAFWSIPYVEAQQPKKVPRIGYLAISSPSSSSTRIDALRQGLRELGLVEGQLRVSNKHRDSSCLQKL